MFKRRLLQAALPLLLLSLGGFGAWLLSLPPAPAGLAGPPVAASETAALLASLAPTRRQRPLIAVVGINDATETTDYLVPTGILRRADVADVVTLASGPGPVRLFPALTVEADATLAAFDARNPAGADYVIVPAMSRDDDPAVSPGCASRRARAQSSSACAPAPRSSPPQACSTASAPPPTGTT